MIKKTLISTTIASLILVGCGSTGTTTTTQALDVNTLPTSVLNDELAYTIEYMVNEEKLAYDVYTDLYNYHLSNSNIALTQFQNVAQYSETNHIGMVEDLAIKYDLETASHLENGVFNVSEIQEMYDALYGNGLASPVDAYQSGCMVEVTDIYDLNEDIIIAQESDAQDAVAVFTMLRDASYNHYWAFDGGLKNMGVTDGCCSIGTIDGVNYCHPEYPQNTQGGGRR